MSYKENIINSQKDLKLISQNENNIIVKAKFGPSKETQIPLIIDENLAFFIGVVIGDGHIKKNKDQIIIELTNIELLKRIQTICKSLFNRHFNLGSKIIRPNKKITQAIYIDSKAICDLMINLFLIDRGKKSHIVSVPKEILNSEINIKKAFLEGIFLTEGGKRHRGYGLSTASHSLWIGIIKLLEELKIEVKRDKWVHQKYKKTYYGISFREEHLKLFMRECRSGQTSLA